MHRDIAEKWIADLRSNPPQVKGKLFDGKGHCCLGRLCVLAGIKPKYDSVGERYIFAGNAFSLPSEVKEWAGMKSDDGKYADTCDDELDRILARDNDSGKNFAEIADIIAANIDEL